MIIINRRDFKVKLTTKVCSNHFKTGYRSNNCPKPTSYLKGYDSPAKNKRRAYPKERLPLDEKQEALNQVNVPKENSYMKEEPKETACGIDDVEKIPELVSQCEDVKSEVLPEICEKTQRRNLFVAQATCIKNCFR